MKKILSIIACSTIIFAATSCKQAANTAVDATKTIDSTVEARLGTLKAELDAKCQARVDSAAMVLADSLKKAGVKVAPVAKAPAKPATTTAKPTTPKQTTTTTTKPATNNSTTVTGVKGTGDHKSEVTGVKGTGENKSQVTGVKGVKN